MAINKTKISKAEHLLFLGIFISMGIYFLSGTGAQAQEAYYYVRAGASGANNGSDWNNAYMTLPSTLVRGATYYMAGGSYGSYTFNTPESGTQIVAIKKATATDHGTDIGWQSNYGDEVAVFDTASISVNTGHLVIDGSTGGGPGNWRSDYGFVFTSPANSRISYISIAGEVSNVILRHIYFNQIGNTEIVESWTHAITNSSNIYDLLVEYCYFDNISGLPFFFRGGSRVILQYNYTGNICGRSVYDGYHCEAMVSHGLSDVHFRWNYISECPSSGGYVKNSSPIASDVRIYGNVFETGFPIQCNTGTCVNWRIFNNTFHSFSGGPWGGDGAKTGWLTYNNILFNPSSWATIGHYGWISKSGAGSCKSNATETSNVVVRFPNNCDAYPEIIDPFMNSPGDTSEDFKLSGPIIGSYANSWSESQGGWVGYDVCQLDECVDEKKYNIDTFGNVRGTDGIWDRGAYEFVSESSPDPIPGDINGDGVVNIFDYNIFLQHFGVVEDCQNSADLNGDCSVDIFDHNILLQNFGRTS